MSWPLASFGVLAVGLALGFAWYERSRPPARVLALVSALAALAVVGRIAFAPLPNVKPTTDIVLFAGLSLGGAPGFMVGAVAALVSNLFFGQGPWTPWQMAAWGGVGLAGAGLGAVTRGRELGRLPLAAACGVAGLGFGMVMDLHLWTLLAEPNLAGYLAVSAGSLAYNVAHVLGNIAFCLLIGPPFVRALRRYRRRFEVRWAVPGPEGAGSPARPSAGAVAAGALAILALGAGALATPPAAEAASAGDRAARFVASAQNADGGFGGARRQSSTQLFTGWAALGLAAANRNPRDVARGRRSVIDAVKARSGELGDTGELERTILVLRASGLTARRFAGRDLRAELLRRRRADGSFDGLVNLTAFGALALRASGDRPGSGPVRAAARFLTAQQNPDGGFGFSTSAPSDVDVTGAALQGLAAAGSTRSTAVRRGVAFLHGAQQPDGGFGATTSAGSNAQSTAFAVQGLVAARRNPDSFRRGRGPLGYLRSLQAADGSVRYSRTSTQTPVWVTSQALLALEREAFPIAPAPRRRTGRAAAAAAGGPGASAGRSEPSARSRAAALAARRARERARAAAAAQRAAAARAAPGGLAPDAVALKPAGTSSALLDSTRARLGLAAAVLLALGLGGLWWRRYAGAVPR